jgi:hypothetical protein
MARTAAWLKTVSGALCALLLLVFTFAPAIDALLCGSEDAPVASAQASDAQIAFSQNHTDKAQHGKAGGEVCAHGHCHHGASAVPSVSAVLAVNDVRPLILAPEAGGVPPSNQPDGPTEPPRA